MIQILVVSSDYKTRQLLRKELALAGYNVTVWDTIPGTIDPSQIVMPTIVIHDWKYSDDSGYLSIWQKLKAHPTTPPIFCLMLTSRSNFSNHVLTLEQGVDDLILKPIKPQELRARVLAGKRTLKLQQDLKVQKQLLETELAEAQAYVRSLLPDDSDEKIPIKARFIPSRLLGGDCYDYYWLDPDYLAIYLLDVSGHGLGSALLSTSVLNVLRSQSLPDVNFYRPEKVLNALNETFQMHSQNEKYFTIWYGVYNRANRQLLYSSAGHPPAVLVSTPKDKPQMTECIRTSGLPIGMLPDIKYQWQRCYIPPDSRLYLFSDGIYEIHQLDNTIMGLDEFIEILSQHKPDNTIDDILRQVNVRTQGRAFSDDLSLLEVCLD
ncbi:MAG: SpoIIE family protein phosphatase [Leptolyngbya sp. SIO1E4]|nr:SpoIIE family protein phosphatase [Leptolyngbya sp. SIO1E4]